MEAKPAAAVAAFARATFAGAFAEAFLRAVTALAVTGAVALLIVRFAGGHVPPHPAWAALLAPAVGFAFWRARTVATPWGDAAQHLDRRLGLHGLLVCANEGVELEPTFRRRLAEQLTRLPAVLPRIRWRRLLPWPLLATAVAVAVAFAPPPPAPPVPPGRTAVAGEIERLGEALRDLMSRGNVPDEQQQELEQKLAELQQRLASGETPEWREVDQLEQRLERERLLQAAGERPAGGDAPQPGGVAGPEITAEQVAAAADALVAAGLLDTLPAGLRALLEAAQREHRVDPTALPGDAEALRRLAEAMAAAAADPGAFAARSALSAEQLADLQAVLAAFPGAGPGGGEGMDGAGEGDGEGAGEAGDGVGRGGVSRGPGHAALSMTENAEGSADAALALPPGVVAPTEWLPIGSRPSEPRVDPRVNPAAGGAGAAGAGGASWQLQLAPRHRAVVRRFFGDGSKTGGKPDGEPGSGTNQGTGRR